MRPRLVNEKTDIVSHIAVENIYPMKVEEENKTFQRR